MKQNEKDLIARLQEKINKTRAEVEEIKKETEVTRREIPVQVVTAEEKEFDEKLVENSLKQLYPAKYTFKPKSELQPENKPAAPRAQWKATDMSLHFDNPLAPKPEEISDVSVCGSVISFTVIPETGNESHLSYFMNGFIRDNVCLVFRNGDSWYYDVRFGDKFDAVNVNYKSNWGVDEYTGFSVGVSETDKFHYHVTLKRMD